MGKRVKFIYCFFVLLLLPLELRADQKIDVSLPYSESKFVLLDYQSPLSLILHANLFETLTKVSLDNEIGLGLAESVSSRDKLKVWGLVLKENLKFSNNKEIDEEAVKSSILFLQQHLTAESKLGTQKMREALAHIKEVKVIRVKSAGYYSGKRRSHLEIILNKGVANFDKLLAFIPILDVESIKQFGYESGEGTLLVSSGPYLVRENRAGKTVRLESIQDFHRAGFPRSKSVQFHYHTDAAAALSALRGGIVDLIVLPTMEQLNYVAADPTLAVLESPFENLKKFGYQFSLPKEFWSDQNSLGDRFVQNKVIARRSLVLDVNFYEEFDFSGTYIP